MIVENGSGQEKVVGSKSPPSVAYHPIQNYQIPLPNTQYQFLGCHRIATKKWSHLRERKKSCSILLRMVTNQIVSQFKLGEASTSEGSMNYFQ
ncbi:unnamed protein product [Caretta caretta]